MSVKEITTGSSAPSSTFSPLSHSLTDTPQADSKLHRCLFPFQIMLLVPSLVTEVAAKLRKKVLSPITCWPHMGPRHKLVTSAYVSSSFSSLFGLLLAPVLAETGKTDYSIRNENARRRATEAVFVYLSCYVHARTLSLITLIVLTSRSALVTLSRMISATMYRRYQSHLLLQWGVFFFLLQCKAIHRKSGGIETSVKHGTNFPFVFLFMKRSVLK